MELKTLASCLSRVPNRFELVSLGWKRAHQLIEGASPLVPRLGEKAEAQALREVAGGAFERADVGSWRPILDPIYEPVSLPPDEELPRDEDRDEDIPE